jgi:transposase-like protein
MKYIEKCPICDTENTRETHSECVGTVEDYYFCSCCGYFSVVEYSPRMTGINLPENMTKAEFMEKYGERVNKHNIQIYLPGEIQI